jgi:GxxExxY protein
MDDELTQRIIGCALRVHYALGPGFLESVYQKALLRELGDARLRARPECRLAVVYKDEVVGEFVADMIVEDRVLIENKAVAALASAHEMQLVNYLTATRIDVGLLFNFGTRPLEIRRKTREYIRKGPDPKPGPILL